MLVEHKETSVGGENRFPAPALSGSGSKSLISAVELDSTSNGECEYTTMNYDATLTPIFADG